MSVSACIDSYSRFTVFNDRGYDDDDNHMVDFFSPRFTRSSGFIQNISSISRWLDQDEKNRREIENRIG